MPLSFSYNIFPLGDQALTVDFGSQIDVAINKEVLGLFQHVRNSHLRHIIDVVPAYSSLTIFYDTVAIRQYAQQNETAFELMTKRLNQLFTEYNPSLKISKSRKVKVPVLYGSSFANDLDEIAAETSLSREEVIGLHHSIIYRIYMIGFQPGFAYMGEVDERIAVKRKQQPSTVKGGSVALAGRQTGIYPFESPGGWKVIGRTPMRIFDRHKENPVQLEPGDKIEFYPITEDEYSHYKQRSS